MQGKETDTAVFRPDGTLRLTVPDKLPPLPEGENSAAISTDGRYLLTASPERSRVWDISKREVIGEIPDFVCTRAVFSDDSRFAFMDGASKNKALVWDVSKGKLVCQLEGGFNFRSLAFNSNGKEVATSSFGGLVQRWDARTGKIVGESMSHYRAVADLTFGADGHHLVTGDEDGLVRIWDASTGALLAPPFVHEDSLRRVLFSPNGSFVLAGGEDGAARLWDAGARPVAAWHLPLQNTVTAAAFSPDGQFLVLGNGEQSVIMNARTGDLVGAPMPRSTECHRLLDVAFSGNGQTIVTGGDDGTAQLWDAAAGKPLGAPLKFPCAVDSVALSPDGKKMLIGLYFARAVLSDARTGKQIGRDMVHPSEARGIGGVAFSSDGRLVITGGADGAARVWDAGTTKPVSPPLRHGDEVTAVALSPDGHFALTGGNDQTARLWNARSGEALGAPLKHTSTVLHVAFSPDGKSAITVTADHRIHRWLLEGTTLRHVATRFYAGADIAPPCFLDKAGERIRVAEFPTGNQVIVRDLAFDLSDIAPLEGDAEALVADWLARLSLEFAPDSMMLRSKWPVPTRPPD
jgi:WD40 repeat protein